MKRFKISGRVVLLVLVLCIAILSSYIYFISPTHIKVSTYTYSNTLVDSNLKGMRIAYLSDFNLSDEDDLDYLDTVINKLNQKDYDLCIIGGDLFNTKKVFSTEKVIKSLSKINCDYGKFATYGDKDLKNKKEIKSIYTEAGIELINNTVRTIYYKDSSFELVACDQDTKLSSIEYNSDKLVIDITHQPDTFKTNAGNISLQLSGHSLGGSIYIPFLGGMIKDKGFKTYNHGKYTKNKSTLIVSNGIKGTTDMPYKVLCSNEILIIKLTTQKESKS